MNIKYNGNTPVKYRTKVDLIVDNKPWYTGYVIDPMASQFTIKVNGHVRFYFYSDEGVTWRKHREEASV